MLVKKSDPRQGSKGGASTPRPGPPRHAPVIHVVAAGKYLVWTLSDLDGAAVTVLLFRAAYTEHWRLPTGRVVAILNADPMPETAERSGLSLSVKHDSQIVALGAAAPARDRTHTAGGEGGSARTPR